MWAVSGVAIYGRVLWVRGVRGVGLKKHQNRPSGSPKKVEEMIILFYFLSAFLVCSVFLFLSSYRLMSR